MKTYICLDADSEGEKFEKWYNKRYEKHPLFISGGGSKLVNLPSLIKAQKINYITFRVALEYETLLNIMYSAHVNSLMCRTLMYVGNKDRADISQFKGKQQKVKKYINSETLDEINQNRYYTCDEIEKQINNLINAVGNKKTTDSQIQQYNQILKYHNLGKLMHNTLKSGDSLKTFSLLQNIFTNQPREIPPDVKLNLKIISDTAIEVTGDALDIANVLVDMGGEYCDGGAWLLPRYKETELQYMCRKIARIYTVPLNINLQKKCKIMIQPGIIKVKSKEMNEDDEEYGMTVEELTNIIPCLECIKRLDIVYFQHCGCYKSSGIYIYDGQNLVALDYNIDEDGGVPRQFKAIDEYPLGYFEHALEVDCAIAIDVNRYIEQLNGNLKTISNKAKITEFIGSDLQQYIVVIHTDFGHDITDINWYAGYFETPICQGIPDDVDIQERQNVLLYMNVHLDLPEEV